MSRRILRVDLPDNSAPAGIHQVAVDRVLKSVLKYPHADGGAVSVRGERYFWSIRPETADEARQREIRETQAEADIKADRGE